MNSLSGRKKCRKVLRLTLIKGKNMNGEKDAKGYAKLIEKANPDFVEVKGYIHVGESQKRLPKSAMPYHEDVVSFSKILATESGFVLKDDFKPSKVVLLSGK